MDSPITRAEHNEFVKRMEEEDRRQNHRLDVLEKSTEAFNKMAANVEKLALNMENMLKELERHGARLDDLEQIPAEKWQTVTKSLITVAVSTIAGGILGAILALAF